MDLLIEAETLVAPLAGRLHQPEGQPRAAVVIAHGLFSSMASQKLTGLARALAGAGYAALQYDAMGCGRTPGEVLQTTLTSRRDELLAAAAWLGGRWPQAPLVYLGSSLGGTAALLAADRQAPAAVIAWSAPNDLQALARPDQDPPSHPPLPALASDLANHDLEAVLARATRVLFVHGQEDEVVPVDQAYHGHRLAQEPKDLLVIPGGDHRLSDPAWQDQATARSLAWIQRMTEVAPG